MIIRKQAPARIGLLGNPSDGYFGKTIACAITNFSATVTLWESPQLQLLPNPIQDPVAFASLDELVDTARRNGYYGGLRLLLATAKKFFEYCRAHRLTLPARNFTVTYDTNIPRQVGLGGSSAIITAAFKALMEFYHLNETDIPLPQQPNIILSVETEELEIAAGLQDRVIQVYGGTVFMDFHCELMQSRGYGEYERLDPSHVPPLFLAYLSEGSESGKVHGNLRYRFQQGEAAVLEAIEEWKSIADEGRAALLARDTARLSALMNRNFDLRRSVLGDEVIGPANLELVRIARDLGHPAKFSGSGGAVVGVYRQASEFEALAGQYRQRGYEAIAVGVDSTAWVLPPAAVRLLAPPSPMGSCW